MEFTGDQWIPRTQSASNAENVSIWWRYHVVQVWHQRTRTVMTYCVSIRPWNTKKQWNLKSVSFIDRKVSENVVWKIAANLCKVSRLANTYGCLNISILVLLWELVDSLGVCRHRMIYIHCPAWVAMVTLLSLFMNISISNAWVRLWLVHWRLIKDTNTCAESDRPCGACGGTDKIRAGIPVS